MPKQYSPERLLTEYCSCVLQVKGREGARGKSQRALPYAVCAKSVYQSRGKDGPGAMACRFSKKVLQTYTAEQLRGWLVFEGVKSAKQAKALSKAQAVDAIHEYLSQKTPERRMNIAYVDKRQGPVAKVVRSSPKPRKRSPVPKLRARAM